MRHYMLPLFGILILLILIPDLLPFVFLLFEHQSQSMTAMDWLQTILSSRLIAFVMPFTVLLMLCFYRPRLTLLRPFACGLFLVLAVNLLYHCYLIASELGSYAQTRTLINSALGVIAAGIIVIHYRLTNFKRLSRLLQQLETVMTRAAAEYSGAQADTVKTDSTAAPQPEQACQELQKILVKLEHIKYSAAGSLLKVNFLGYTLRLGEFIRVYQALIPALNGNLQPLLSLRQKLIRKKYNLLPYRLLQLPDVIIGAYDSAVNPATCDLAQLKKLQYNFLASLPELRGLRPEQLYRPVLFTSNQYLTQNLASLTAVLLKVIPHLSLPENQDAVSGDIGVSHAGTDNTDTALWAHELLSLIKRQSTSINIGRYHQFLNQYCWASCNNNPDNLAADMPFKRKLQQRQHQQQQREQMQPGITPEQAQSQASGLNEQKPDVSGNTAPSGLTAPGLTELNPSEGLALAFNEAMTADNTGDSGTRAGTAADAGANNAGIGKGTSAGNRLGALSGRMKQEKSAYVLMPVLLLVLTLISIFQLPHQNMLRMFLELFGAEINGIYVPGIMSAFEDMLTKPLWPDVALGSHSAVVPLSLLPYQVQTLLTGLAWAFTIIMATLVLTLVLAVAFGINSCYEWFRQTGQKSFALCFFFVLAVLGTLGLTFNLYTGLNYSWFKDSLKQDIAALTPLTDPQPEFTAYLPGFNTTPGNIIVSVSDDDTGKDVFGHIHHSFHQHVPAHRHKKVAPESLETAARAAAKALSEAKEARYLIRPPEDRLSNKELLDALQQLPGFNSELKWDIVFIRSDYEITPLIPGDTQGLKLPVIQVQSATGSGQTSGWYRLLLLAESAESILLDNSPEFWFYRENENYQYNLAHTQRYLILYTPALKIVAGLFILPDPNLLNTANTGL